MTQHRFLLHYGSPPEDHTCTCGKRGMYQDIERHITEMWNLSASPDNFDDGVTKAHYLPMEPREPAPPSEQPPHDNVDGHSRSIAALFQDMLRAAFQAGAASTKANESFETWYQRYVLH